MARNYFTQTTSAEIALVAATVKTVLQLLAAANIRVAIQSIMVTFDGTSNTAEPVKVDILRQTTAGTGGNARNPLQKDDSIADTLQVSGLEDIDTAEPTAGAILYTFNLHPQAGAQMPLPFPGEIIIGGGDRLGIRCTAPANVNVLITIEGEE